MLQVPHPRRLLRQPGAAWRLERFFRAAAGAREHWIFSFRAAVYRRLQERHRGSRRWS